MVRNLKIKVCGMTNRANVEEICRLGPDYLGFIFYSRSVRYVGSNPDPGLFSDVPQSISKTAVFVNEYYERMIDITGKYGIDVIQLHGMESPETCNALRIHGKKVIKVFPGDQLENIKLLNNYTNAADYFLFDTPVLSYGGSGRKFDWSVLAGLKSNVKFFLSGGITVHDVEQLRSINIPALYAADINSRFEVSEGIKDPELVGKFIKALRDGE